MNIENQRVQAAFRLIIDRFNIRIFLSLLFFIYRYKAELSRRKGQNVVVQFTKKKTEKLNEHFATSIYYTENFHSHYVLYSQSETILKYTQAIELSPYLALSIRH